jgi:hypothetical protein
MQQNSKLPNQINYKTIRCWFYERGKLIYLTNTLDKICKFSQGCHFAHGDLELRRTTNDQRGHEVNSNTIISNTQIFENRLIIENNDLNQFTLNDNLLYGIQNPLFSYNNYSENYNGIEFNRNEIPNSKLLKFNV